jgi:hypothetical protein
MLWPSKEDYRSTVCGVPDPTAHSCQADIFSLYAKTSLLSRKYQLQNFSLSSIVTAFIIQYILAVTCTSIKGE